MVPVLLGTQLFEILLQLSAHLDNTVSHALEFAEPLLVELLVVEDFGGDARAVDGRG